jgi:hypothetical protein
VYCQLTSAGEGTVKNLKMLMLVFGILGIVSMFIPTHGMTLFSLFKLLGTGQLVIMLAAFALPAAMGGMAVSKPPLQRWQSIVALLGSALACWKLEIWKTLAHIGELFKALPMLLIVVAAVGGLVVAILSLAKAEQA